MQLYSKLDKKIKKYEHFRRERGNDHQILYPEAFKQDDRFKSWFRPLKVIIKFNTQCVKCQSDSHFKTSPVSDIEAQPEVRETVSESIVPVNEDQLRVNVLAKNSDRTKVMSKNKLDLNCLMPVPFLNEQEKLYLADEELSLNLGRLSTDENDFIPLLQKSTTDELENQLPLDMLTRDEDNKLPLVLCNFSDVHNKLSVTLNKPIADANDNLPFISERCSSDTVDQKTFSSVSPDEDNYRLPLLSDKLITDRITQDSSLNKHTINEEVYQLSLKKAADDDKDDCQLSLIEPTTNKDTFQSSSDKSITDQSNYQLYLDKCIIDDADGQFPLEKPATDEDDCRSFLEKPATDEDDCRSFLEKPATDKDDCRSSLEKPATDKDDCRSSLEKPATDKDDCHLSLDEPATGEDACQSLDENITNENGCQLSLDKPVSDKDGYKLFLGQSTSDEGLNMEHTKAMVMNTEEGSNTPVCANKGNTSNELQIPLSQSQTEYDEDFVTDNELAIRHFLPLPAAYDKWSKKLRTTPKDAKDYALIKTEYNKVRRELDVATVNLDGIDLLSFPGSVEELDEIVTRVKARRNTVNTDSFATHTKPKNSKSPSDEDGFKVLIRKLTDKPMGDNSLHLDTSESLTCDQKTGDLRNSNDNFVVKKISKHENNVDAFKKISKFPSLQPKEKSSTNKSSTESNSSFLNKGNGFLKKCNGNSENNTTVSTKATAPCYDLSTPGISSKPTYLQNNNYFQSNANNQLIGTEYNSHNIQMGQSNSLNINFGNLSSALLEFTKMCKIFTESLQRREQFNNNEVVIVEEPPEENSVPIRVLIGIALKSNVGFYDAHCHLDILLDKDEFGLTFEVYQRKEGFMFPRNYKGCITTFCKPSSFTDETVWTRYLSQRNVWATFGCHPCNAHEFDSVAEQNLLSVLSHPKVKGLGEIGLDYSTRNKCPREIQKAVFRRQLIIGYSKQLPLVIHCREAHEDCIQILWETIPYDYTFHLHCFAENWYWADRWLKTFPNVYIGITNLVTFASRDELREVARRIPLDRLLLETDAPYCIPKICVLRIRYSHPGMALHAGVQIAAVRNISADDVFYWTARNTEFVYKLKKKAKKTRA